LLGGSLYRFRILFSKHVHSLPFIHKLKLNSLQLNKQRYRLSNRLPPDYIDILIAGYQHELTNKIKNDKAHKSFITYFPNVKKVGTNTKGQVHFGNVGKLILRNSGIIVQLATSYNMYFDRRFIEKVGIAPDIYITDDQDAMNVAIADFFSNGS
jgi:hypothetical protein